MKVYTQYDIPEKETKHSSKDVIAYYNDYVLIVYFNSLHQTWYDDNQNPIKGDFKWIYPPKALTE